MSLRLLAILLAFHVACSGPAQEGGEGPLQPMPRPDLSRVEEAVRRQLEEEAAEVAALVDAGTAPSELGAAWGELGRLYHAYDLLDAAAACYENARALAADDVRWSYYLGFLHQVRGELEPAAERFREVLARRGDDPATLLRLADVFLELDRPDAARPLFERALELDPASAAAHHGLGKIAARDDDFASAAEHFERALALQPGATLVHYPLAQAYRALGERDKAEQHLRRRGNAGTSFPDPLVHALDQLAVGAGLRLTRAGVALAEGRRDAALAEYRQAVEADPRNVAARLDLGRLLALEGDLEGARAEIEVALAVEPGNAAAHDALGAVLAAAGDDEKAIASYRQAVELDSSLADAHFRLGAALVRQGRHSEAAASFSTVLEIEPRHLEARLARATALLDLDDLAAARSELERLLAVDPQNARAHLRLGEVLQRLGEGAAFEAYARAVALGLEKTSERAAAHLSLGNLLAARRDDETAAEHYRAAIEIAPELAEAHFNLAGVLGRLGRRQEGTKHYQKVVELQPDNVEAGLYLAQDLLVLGRPDEAAQRFTDVVSRAPDREPARLGEASALAAAGRYREARERLEAALAALPRSGMVAHALARFLAACPDRSLRDGRRALELALAVLESQQRSGRPPIEYAETVAMAFAEAGRFEEAVRWQREVIGATQRAGDPARLEILRRNLARYERDEACCAGE